MNQPQENFPAPNKPKICCSARLAVALGCFVSVFNLTHIRIYVSFAMVCMVKYVEKNITKQELDCPPVETNSNPYLYEFEWSSELRGHLISGAFYGFLLGPFIAGILSYKYGGKRVLIVGTIISGFTSATLPELTRIHPQIFFAVRIISGFFGGFILPSFYDIMSHWIVPEERQLLVGGALTGIPFASFSNYPIQGLICSYLGWIYLFYTSSIWLVFCGICFCFLIYDHPEHCPFISEKEIAYIQSKIINPNLDVPIPWGAIFKSLPIWAYIVIHFCVNYGFLTILLSLPLFMKDVHRFDLQSNGVLSGLPFIGAFLSRLLLSIFFEKLRLKLNVSKNLLRKSFVFTGTVVTSFSLLAVTFLSCRYRYLVLGLFVLSVIGVELTLTSGYLLSLLDLCPSYTNVLTGVSNAIANLAALLGPVLTGIITAEGNNWEFVHFSVIAVFIFACIFYLMFGKNERLPWDKVVTEEIPSFHRESAVY